jgi:hypothetical protein
VGEVAQHVDAGTPHAPAEMHARFLRYRDGTASERLHLEVGRAMRLLAEEITQHSSFIFILAHAHVNFECIFTDWLDKGNTHTTQNTRREDLVFYIHTHTH